MEFYNNTIKAVEYFLTNNQLQRNVYLNSLLTNDSPQVVLDNVTGLAITYGMSGTKIVNATVALKVKSDQWERTLVSALVFRNAQ